VSIFLRPEQNASCSTSWWLVRGGGGGSAVARSLKSAYGSIDADRPQNKMERVL
jgi:hypothetical protein